MATSTVSSSLAVPPVGTMPVHTCLYAKKACHLNPLPVSNLPGLSFSTSRGEARRRMTYRTTRVLAAAAQEGSEGAQATDAGKKQGNGVPVKRDQSTSVQHTRRGRPRSLARQFRGLNDIFPFPRSLRQMLNLMDLVFDDPIFSPRDVAVNQLRDTIRTPWDVKEEENAYLLRVDLPGYSRDQVKLYVEEGYLVIKAGEGSGEMEDKSTSEDKGDKSVFRSYGFFTSRVLLSDNVDVQKISAELKNGVLMVTLPKVEGTSKKEVHDIEVQ